MKVALDTSWSSEGSPSRDHCTHRQRAMAGLGAVILLNGSFTISPSEN